MNTLKDRITTLLEDISKTHIYKSSLIYELYNEAYNKNEKTSTCRSCLISRTRLLQKWLENNPLPQEPIMEPVVEGQGPIAQPTIDVVEKGVKKKKRN